jgi:3',5'-cyclic AMP phosphodiesterase CpdA
MSDTDRPAPSDISTIKDAHLSLWQAAVSEAVDEAKGKSTAAGGETKIDPLEAATAAVVEAKDPCVDCNETPPADEELAELSALHYQIAEAELSKNPIDKRIAERILASVDAESTPAGSIMRTAVGMFKIFANRLNRPVYHNWKEEGKGNIDYSTIVWRLREKGRVAIISDWGTGYSDAIAVLRAAVAFDPDAIIHLGDIYFAGTEGECRLKVLNPVKRWARRDDGRPIPFFNLAGNHDYYSGGGGFHWLLGQLNEGETAQPASYFTLRSEDDGWQFLAMDTGFDSRHDVIYSHQFGAVPQPDEIEWLHHKLETFPGRTHLLSHHQAWSNHAEFGGDEDDRVPPFDAVNKRHLAVEEPNREKITGRFSGHQHNLMVYKPFMGLNARCVGHSARPVRYRGEEIEKSYRYAINAAHLDRRPNSSWLNHGFEIIDLQGKGKPSEVSYYQVLADGLPDLVYRELMG